ncbi:aldo/keto reductase [Marivirga lumbricoides]|uniref:Aldo/keto reductase n=1 Tax=Marivirga lumbricoides TaxID=1046115 RepID=A0ABQ1MW33_9BACT|nr:aldo/keto reductase [Marivirga lumbricoides]
MKYNMLGNTGLLVSELCLGTMTFGGKGYWTAIGQLDQKPVDDLMKKAVESGINFIDTANVYSEGLSEEMTGQSIKNLGLKREELILATKVRGTMGEAPNQTGLSRGHIFKEVDSSLKRLKTDYIDLYQIHGFDPFTPIEETLQALDDIVKAGKVRYIGCSNLAAWQIMKALAYSDKHHLSKFISLQAYYTIAGRDLEREIIPLLKDQKLGLMVWSPLAGGILSGKYSKDGKGPEGARRVDFDFPPINKDRAFSVLDVLHDMAKEKNVSVAQLSLAWLLHQSAVSSVIIGAKKMEQLEDNLKATEVQFSEKELQQLDEVSQLPPEYPGWMLERQGRDRRQQQEDFKVKKP